MQVLIDIAKDLLGVLNPYELEWIGIKGAEDPEAKILQILDEENRQQSGLRQWISERFGAILIGRILDNHNIPYRKGASPHTLIDKWFEFREVTMVKPRARPLELTKTIMEQASQIKSAPGKLRDIEPLMASCELLMRYLGYFYASELLKHKDMRSLSSVSDDSTDSHDSADVKQALRELTFGQLCELLTCEQPLKSAPYDPNCDRLVKLVDDKVKLVLARLPALAGNSLPEEPVSEAREVSDCVIELLEYWRPTESTIIPKGAVVVESQMSAFDSRATCCDELNDTLTIKGIKAAVGVGDDILLSTMEAQIVWAPKLESLPKDKIWITPVSSLSALASAINKEPATESRAGGKLSKNRVFISYSHTDRVWAERVLTHLKLLERDGIIELWADVQIEPGEQWNEKIRHALSSVQIAILLISTDFLASEFITREELPLLLRAAEEDGARVIPLIVKPSRFESIEPLSRFQAINDPSKSLVELSEGEQEKILVKLTKAIEQLCKQAHKMNSA